MGSTSRCRPRECFGLLGPNGAGKTTTIRMLTCFSPIDAGRLAVFGLPVNARERARDQESPRGGAAGGEPRPRPHGRDEPRDLRELLRDRAAPRRGRASPSCSPSPSSRTSANDRIPTLSGGMKRRLVLARALVNRPSLLVLDEPTTGLDPQARHLVWERLRELKRSGVAMLLTTHYMEEAAQLCDRLVVMDHGRIIAEGTPASLIARARRARRHRDRDRATIRRRGRGRSRSAVRSAAGSRRSATT